MGIEFSLKEAAAIVDLPEPFVRKAIEARTLRPRAVSSGRAVRYRFGVKDMLLLKLIGEFPLGLDKTDKAALRTLVDGTRRSVGKWQARKSDFVVRSGDLVLCVEVKTVRDALAHNLVNYARGRRRVVSSPSVLGGEPVFKGTRIPVAQVAGLIAKGVPLAEIAQDYPALTTVDIAYASIHAKMKRNPGRPRKALRLLRKAGARATAGMRRRRS
jgi:uncharacterized protein (DUF433 family)